MRFFSYIIIILLFFAGLIFAFLNHGQVTFNYFLGSKQISLSLLLVFALGIGILLGFLTAIFYWIKLKSENYHLKLRLKKAEKEIG